MPKCYEEDVTAPRAGCPCRQCYNARQMSLDPRLIELARSRHFGEKPIFSPAREMVYRYLEMYLMGRIEWAALNIEIIEALVKQNDDAHGRLLEMTSLQVMPHFISKNP